MSGGGVGAGCSSLGVIRTPATSPTNAVPRLRVPVADVVRGVPGRVGDLEAGRAARRRAARARSPPAPGDLAPTARPCRRRRAGSRSPAAARVDQVRRAALVHPDLELGEALDERAGGAGVVEVDVRQREHARALVAERLEQRRRRVDAGPAVDQHVADRQTAITPRVPAVVDVDRLRRHQRIHLTARPIPIYR